MWLPSLCPRKFAIGLLQGAFGVLGVLSQRKSRPPTKTESLTIGFNTIHCEESNQALKRTADRRENLLSMASTLKSEAQLAVVSGRSACFR